MPQITAKHWKTAMGGYLYADGHVVLRHARNDARAGRVEWLTIHEALVDHCLLAGRLQVSSRPLLRLVLQVERVEVAPPSLDNGSIRTRELAIDVGYVSIYLPGEIHAANWPILPNLLGGDFSIDAGDTAEYADHDALSTLFGLRIADRIPSPLAVAS